MGTNNNDRLAWLGGSAPASDLDADGLVDVGDMLTLLARFGATCGAAGASAGVPVSLDPLCYANATVLSQGCYKQLLMQGVPRATRRGSHSEDPLAPVEDPLDSLHIRKRARTSVRAFGSTVSPTAAH
jgi:hypothetical protein